MSKTTATVENTIPAGWIPDAQGRLVRADAVPAQDVLRDQLVREIVAGAKFRAANLKAWRAQVLADVQAFAETVAEKYKVKLSRGQNVTLNSFDGALRVIIARDNRETFNEQLTVAKQMIWACVERWTEGSRSEIRALVNAAFKTSRNGKLSISKIMSLKQVEIDDPEWLRAMDALTDSLQIVGSATYIRVFERVGSTDKYSRIEMDVYPGDDVIRDETADDGQEGGAS